ncbi:MAG: DUF4340 domain-containing protein [Verrucomicrobiota bacterium]
MGSKALIRLLIVLAIIGAIAAILHFAGSGGGVSTVSSTTDKKKVIEAFPINDVASIRVSAPDGEVTLTKGESAWEIAERGGYPADTGPISDFLKTVWDLNVVQVIPIGRSQYGRLGLLGKDEGAPEDETATLLTFKGADDKELGQLWLGKVYERSENRPNPFGGGMATSEAGRYVKTGASNTVYLVGETFADVNSDPADWLKKDFFKVDQITVISVNTGDKEKDWKLTRKTAADEFSLVGAAEGEELDTTKTTPIRGSFSNPQMEDVFSGAEAEKNKTDKATFQIKTAEGFSYTIKIGEKNDLNELPLTMTVDGGFEEKRKQGEEESDEEKEKLDKEFEAELTRLKEKLADEKKLEGHVFKIRSYIVDSILKERSELLKVPEEAEGADGEEIAPGVTLPIPQPAP